jgi:hypothetical protein
VLTTRKTWFGSCLPIVLWFGVVGFMVLGVTRRANATDFRDVPRVTAQVPERFRTIFESAREGVVRVAVFGDSQETAPNGWGGHYIAHLCAGFAELYGPATESVFIGKSTHASIPQWLATVRESSAISPSVLPPSSWLPSTFPVSLRRTGLSGSDAWSSAWRSVFLHDASLTIDPALASGPWFDQTGPYRAEVLLAARKGASALEWANAPTDASLYDDIAPIVATGVFPPIRKGAEGSLAWMSTPPLAFAGKRHLQLLLRGADPKSGAEFVGMRWKSDAPPRGVVVQGFSKGGMRLGQLVGSHSDADELLKAIAPHVAVLHFGANDAGNGITPSEWRSQLEAAIAWIRASMDDPSFPVIIAAELRVGFSPTPWIVFDWMPVIAHEIALRDSNVLALNLHRTTHEEYLWGPNSADLGDGTSWMPYLFDSAHLRPYAQKLLAQAFVGELTHALSITRGNDACVVWADCVRSFGASCMSLTCRTLIDVDAAALGLDFEAGASCLDADGDGAADLCGPVQDPDFDANGFVDAADLAQLLTVWGLSHTRHDLDNSGLVDAADIGILLSSWGPVP